MHSIVVSYRSIDVVFKMIDFDIIAPKVVDLLKLVQSVMHNNIMSPRYMDIIFKRIYFVVKKKN